MMNEMNDLAAEREAGSLPFSVLVVVLLTVSEYAWLVCCVRPFSGWGDAQRGNGQTGLSGGGQTQHILFDNIHIRRKCYTKIARVRIDRHTCTLSGDSAR